MSNYQPYSIASLLYCHSDIIVSKIHVLSASFKQLQCWTDLVLPRVVVDIVTPEDTRDDALKLSVGQVYAYALARAFREGELVAGETRVVEISFWEEGAW